MEEPGGRGQSSRMYILGRLLEHLFVKPLTKPSKCCIMWLQACAGSTVGRCGDGSIS